MTPASPRILRWCPVVVMLAFGVANSLAQSALDGFDPNANGAIQVFVVQPDGKILIGGAFTTLAPNGGASVTRNRIARLNSDGSLDSTFNPNANNTVWSIALQADGKILAGGEFTNLDRLASARSTCSRSNGISLALGHRWPDAD